MTSLDWSQLYWPGPRRVFTAAEMARAGQQPWPRGVDAYVLLLVLLNLVPLLLHDDLSLPLLAASLLMLAFGLAVARHLWRWPSRTRFNLINIVASIVLIAALVLATRVFHLPRTVVFAPLLTLGGIFFVSMLSWWVVVILRAQQIEGRLAELDEQDRGIALARRLATAQIQPHFLFNTLASVQHWVDTQDDRAGPTLRAFTSYLRSTLPMFEREALPLADELQIVRHYLTVMQARLGERLAWAVEADPALEAIELPPGTLLTLVENAIAHGIEPALRGGRVEVRAFGGARGQSIFEVSDDGAGLCGEAPEGVGLSNTRTRLAQQYAERARLTLTSRHPGGCLARIEIDPR